MRRDRVVDSVMLTLRERLIGFVLQPHVIAMLGAVLFAIIPFVHALTAEYPHFGVRIYDEYYKAILVGRLDLPPRLLRFEGHYALDGTGYLYHGLAPLITRFAFGWIWPFEAFSMAPFSVWLWAVVGTLGYQGTLLVLMRAKQLDATLRGRTYCMLLCLGLWVSSPGLLLSSSATLFHEPIAVSYAMGGLFIFVYLRWSLGLWSIWRTLPTLAVLAGMVVHARPNLAVELYVTVCLLALYLLVQKVSWSKFLAATLAIAILGANGLAYLKFNEVRFGSASRVHGSFESGDIQYGPIFWGYEDPDSGRASAFVEHGYFNVHRILPNLGLYMFYVPVILGFDLTRRISNWFLITHEKMTKAKVGFIAVGRGSIGLIFIWMPWIILASVGMLGFWRDRFMMPLIVGSLIAACLTLSFAALAPRYSFDIWLFLMAFFFYTPRHM